MTTLSPGARDASQRERVAGQPLRRGVDHRPAARPFEEEDLVPRHLLVEQAEVIEVGVEVLPHPAEVGQGDGLPGAPLVAGRGRLGEHHREIDEQVLVRQRDPDRVGRNRTEHGLDLTGARSWHGLLRRDDVVRCQEALPPRDRRLGARSS